MGDLIDIILAFGVPAILLLLGLVIGSAIESAHFRRLAVEEQSLANIMVSDLKRLPENWEVSGASLVVGQVVIATDYFKVFIATLRNLVGGRVRGYEALMERARREALVRMTREAEALGANVVWGVLLQTSTIQGDRRNKSAGIEAMAYGTAMRVTSKPGVVRSTMNTLMPSPRTLRSV